ncbi:site-specific recombinase [Myxococcus xanthus]|uniref:site-specific recombinase n=1 Tax=Myxococcus xanthus TaxID=34 RepID=UPI0011279F52|nr:site-specific recombinase [Myxococcus xanthus]QDE86016.1 gliding motility protein [Myxococcus xanthus]QDF00192.1 gliding motility protein [Myxococcus xanthus]QDF07958.1 gliding motility protein [Myxococcus xanthus]
MTDPAPVQSPAPRQQPSAREVDAFCMQYAPRAPGHSAVRDLYRLLCDVPEGGLEDRLQWVERWMQWLRERIPAHALVDASEPEVSAADSRLALMVRVLEGEPAMRATLTRLVAAVFEGSRGLKLFAQVGLPAGQGFFAEASDRLARSLLPAPPEPGKLSELLLRLCPDPDDADWLARLSPARLAQLAALVGEPASPEPMPGARVRADLMDALLLLAVQVAALGMAEDVRDRSPETSFRASPFLRMRLVCDAVLARDAAADTLRDLSQCVADCRQVVGSVSRHLEDAGVSVDLVYRLERIRRGLERMEAIARVLGAPRGEARWREAMTLVSDLLRRAHADRSVVELVKRNMRMLARKIIERAGHSGEHYITSTREGFHAMVHSAAGGGLVTAAAVAIKVFLSGLVLAPFFSFMAVGLNYALSFLLIQALGFTLATKQPSVTAATLAGAVGEGARGERLANLVELIPRITRSQLAAFAGNLGVVAPVAIVFALGYQFITGHAFMSQAKAQAMVASLHPWKSGTLLFAAMTGVLLWMSSVAGGWLENFVVYRRLPEALAHHRLPRRLLGEARARRLAAGFQHAASGLGANVTLGFMLALAPVVGRFFGLTLDVRHVTFVLGSLSLAGTALGPGAVLQPEFLAALAGMALTGLINFWVSFSLALGVAVRARDVPTREALPFLRAVLAHLVKHPRSFLLPPKEPENDVLRVSAPPAP